jgi:site-specific DNA recombinase
MKQTEQVGAVLYVRVSTDEQAREALNIANQEQRCRTFCSGRELKVLQVFVDPGESARSDDRPEFQKMLAYCKAHRSETAFVVVYDLSRFARNVRDQADAIAKLLEIGVRVRSTLEPNVDETSSGKLAANIHGAFNQFFSDSLSERMRERSKAAVLAGRWPWSAPLGYKNIDCRDGANIIPDPETAPHIRRAFELMATGLYTRAAVLRKITDAGLRTQSGNKLSAQTFYETLRKQVYVGFITSSAISEPVQGLHTPIVDRITFDRVQAILDGKKLKAAKKNKHNSAFPLKPFVRCETCGRPLTGGFAKSHTGRTYPRYWCPTTACHVGISREELESRFVDLLGRLSPRAEAMVEFPKIAARVWEESQGDAQANAKKISAQLDKLKVMKKKLLASYLEGKVPEDDYQEATADYSRQITDLERQLRELTEISSSTEAFVSFAELQLSDLSGLWKAANDDQRRRVQTILFRDGLAYSPKSKSLNPDNSTLFSVLTEMNPENLRLASPTGFEPVLPP